MARFYLARITPVLIISDIHLRVDTPKGRLLRIRAPALMRRWQPDEKM